MQVTPRRKGSLLSAYTATAPLRLSYFITPLKRIPERRQPLHHREYTGTANAGKITINAGNQFTMTNSSVATEAKQESGGHDHNHEQPRRYGTAHQ